MSLSQRIHMYVNSPFNYTGNKFKLLPQLVAHLPESTDNMTLVDLFSGSGTVSFNLAGMFKNVVSNEYIFDIQRIQKVLSTGSDTDFARLIECLKMFSSSDYDRYQILRDEYNSLLTSDFTGSGEYINDKITFLNYKAYRLYGLMLSCTNNMMRFNRHGLFNQTCGKRMYNESTEKKLTEWRNLLKTIRNVDIIWGDFETVSANSMRVQNMSDVFFYADPPYSNTEAGYNAFWKQNDDERLFKFITDFSDAKWMISGTDIHGDERCKLLDLLSESGKFKMIELEYDYKKVAKKKSTETHEVIMVNY